MHVRRLGRVEIGAGAVCGSALTISRSVSTWRVGTPNRSAYRESVTARPTPAVVEQVADPLGRVGRDPAGGRRHPPSSDPRIAATRSGPRASSTRLSSPGPAPEPAQMVGEPVGRSSNSRVAGARVPVAQRQRRAGSPRGAPRTGRPLWWPAGAPSARSTRAAAAAAPRPRTGRAGPGGRPARRRRRAAAGRSGRPVVDGGGVEQRGGVLDGAGEATRPVAATGAGSGRSWPRWTPAAAPRS